jgi:hypothetical protein
MDVNALFLGAATGYGYYTDIQIVNGCKCSVPRCSHWIWILYRYSNSKWMYMLCS